MDRREQRERVAEHPRAVRFEELAALLEACGWTSTAFSGSHHIFVRGGETLSVPFRRPQVLPVYVRRVLRLTEGEDDEEEADDNSE